MKHFLIPVAIIVGIAALLIASLGSFFADDLFTGLIHRLSPGLADHSLSIFYAITIPSSTLAIVYFSRQQRPALEELSRAAVKMMGPFFATLMRWILIGFAVGAGYFLVTKLRG